jgi:divalent metal cation (Fe/Co/Zn/Cd) transporter
MDKKKKSGYKTLLLSVILSSPGPLVLGYGLTLGRSSTQISDFTRRTAELLAIIASFVVYVITSKEEGRDAKWKSNIERKSNIFVGFIMCVSGISMLILTFTSDTQEKGNVFPAFCIALFGAIVNTLFYFRYSSLHREIKNAILGIQARLYGAKSIVDICVTLTLLAVVIMPSSKFSFYLDIVGSVLVSAYMLRCGIMTIRENIKKEPQ